MTEPKYPEVLVQLSNEDGNPLMIVGRTRSALRKYGLKEDEIIEFSKEALSGDYDHVLQTVMKWVATS